MSRIAGWQASTVHVVGRLLQGLTGGIRGYCEVTQVISHSSEHIVVFAARRLWVAALSSQANMHRRCRKWSKEGTG